MEDLTNKLIKIVKEFTKKEDITSKTTFQNLNLDNELETYKLIAEIEDKLDVLIDNNYANEITHNPEYNFQDLANYIKKITIKDKEYPLITMTE